MRKARQNATFRDIFSTGADGWREISRFQDTRRVKRSNEERVELGAAVLSLTGLRPAYSSVAVRRLGLNRKLLRHKARHAFAAG
jgi:hypothetical protein